MKLTKTKLALCAALAMGLAARSQAQTLLYQWNFNGVSGTGVPNVTAGGGTLTASGVGSFTGTGVSGGTGDFAYSSTGASGYANAGITTAGNALTGLSGVNQFTVTFLINPYLTYLSQPAISGTNVARFIQIGPTSGYDESGVNTQGGANNANAGISIAQSGSSLQVGYGQAPTYLAPDVFAPYSSNQWLLVAFEYDGTAASATSSSALQSAIGNGLGDAAVFTGNGVLNAPIMLGMTNTAGAVISTGLAASELMMLGNRNSANRGWDGEIEGVSIYNGLLSTSQLDALVPTPEPSSLALIGLGFGGLVTMIRRRRHN
jgi:hypothetical protein